MSKLKIGILDSGMGGLSVLHYAKMVAPDIDYVFYADEEHVPYGEKKLEEVRSFTQNIIEFLIDKGVDAVIIACNTATSSVPKEVRDSYSIPVIGMEPALKKAIDLYGNENKRILVTATEITINGEKMQNLANQVDIHHQADLVALPGLVRFAEKGVFEGEEVNAYLREALASFNLEDYGTVVPGCTHFGYFKKAFSEVFPGKLHFVDGNEGTVRQVLRCLGGDKSEKCCHRNETTNIEYYFSGKKITEKDMDKINASFKQLDAVYNIN